LAAAAPFPPRLWRRVNDHFRASGQFYVDAPRPRPYAKKERQLFASFPGDADLVRQAAYLVKNLVNVQRYPDANKRTASVLLEVFVETRGHELTCTDAQYAEFLLQVQRRVPPAYWDGRSFSLRLDHIPWRDDAYHSFLLAWLTANLKKKN
jgi:prophage maintenance system killer protein